jgi:hypothetical protein
MPDSLWRDSSKLSGHKGRPKTASLSAAAGGPPPLPSIAGGGVLQLVCLCVPCHQSF